MRFKKLCKTIFKISCWNDLSRYFFFTEYSQEKDFCIYIYIYIVGYNNPVPSATNAPLCTMDEFARNTKSTRTSRITQCTCMPTSWRQLSTVILPRYLTHLNVKGVMKSSRLPSILGVERELQAPILEIDSSRFVYPGIITFISLFPPSESI